MPRRYVKRIFGNKCTVCNHPDRPQIDLALAAGCTRRVVAERFSISPDAAHRHSRDHLSPEVKAALALKLIRKEGDNRAVLLEEGATHMEAARAIRAPLFSLFLTAVDTGDSRAAAALSGRLHENLQFTAKLAGELIPAIGTSVQNIVISADYVRLRTELLGALRHYPEAAQAVAEVFRRTGEAAADEMRRSVPRAMIEGTATEMSSNAA
jgi:hypothetical protein